MLEFPRDLFDRQRRWTGGKRPFCFDRRARTGTRRTARFPSEYEMAPRRSRHRHLVLEPIHCLYPSESCHRADPSPSGLQTRFWVVVATRMEELVLHPTVKPVQMIAFRQLDSNGTARVGGGHRGVTEIVRSLESTAVGDTGQVSHRARHDDPRVSYTVAVRIL